MSTNEETAAARIRHVVVLMLENRSFDNLLGFLEHPEPAYPKLESGTHGNPLDLADGDSPVFPVTDDGEQHTVLDPPHSFGSVMEQLNVGPTGRAKMNGFVAAHAQKAAGKEPIGVVHWGRIGGLLIAVLGALTGWVARRAGWRPRCALTVFGGSSGLAVAGLWWLRRRALRTPGPEAGRPAPDDVGPEVMRCLAPAKLPVLARLAREFGVCTRWFSSVPGETWPNRNFVHAATSDGAVNIEIGFYDDRTIFDQLEEAEQSWRIYCGGQAQLLAFAPLLSASRLGNWRALDEFEADVAAGRLARYTFIEPVYTGGDSNSQHPNSNRTEASRGADFRRGEALLARVYEALRANPEVFDETALVITYDEHGGLFDHVPPARVPAPRRLSREGEPTRSVLDAFRLALAWFFDRSGDFAFTTTGARVPAVVVSPWVQRHRVDDTPYDHTSIIATARQLFAPHLPALTARDERANSFSHLFVERSTPRSGSELPDLSEHLGVAQSDVRDVSGPKAGTAVEPDEFHQQLDAITSKVHGRVTEVARAHDSLRASVGEAVDELDHFCWVLGLERP